MPSTRHDLANNRICNEHTIDRDRFDPRQGSALAGTGRSTAEMVEATRKEPSCLELAIFVSKQDPELWCF